METSNLSSGEKQTNKITEEVCFELLYFAKLVKLINVISMAYCLQGSEKLSKIFNHLGEHFSNEQNLTEGSGSDLNYLVLDSNHTAQSSFKKLKDLIGLDKDDDGLDQTIDEITQFIEKDSEKKKMSKSSNDLVALQSILVKDPVRIYIDGGFDLIHSGHYNAIRQAKALGDILVVGVNSDAEILRNKGPTVLSCKERADILRACKWVDEVHEDTEYTVRLDTLDRYNCQFYAHGDDPVFDADGTDMCGFLQQHGRFKMFKRTEGVSTTDIVGKLLLLTKDNTVKGRSRTASFEKPLVSNEYVKEVRRIEHEEVKNETPNFSSLAAVTER